MKNKIKTTFNSISIKLVYFIIGSVCAIIIIVGAYSVHASITGVSSGQFLTANKMNEIINAINSLENRGSGALVCSYKNANSKTGAGICNAEGEYCMHAYLAGYGLNNCHQNLPTPWAYLCCKVD